jgi:chromosomal replication initiator protein
MSDDLWQRGCTQLAAELPEQQFNTWIRPLPPADVAIEGDSAVVSLRVPNRFKLDWIRSQYAGRIQDVLSRLAGRPVSLQLHLAPPAPRAAASTAAPSAALSAGTDSPDAAPAAGARHVPAPLPRHALPVHRLNPRSPSTPWWPAAPTRWRAPPRCTWPAPGPAYNPLFIYGGVGLGKTHLIHAVGNALLKDRPTPACCTCTPSSSSATW